MDDGELDAEKSGRRQRWERAITISILAVIASGILTFAARDKFFHVRQGSHGPCIANLRSIDGAKGKWALENQKASNAIPADADLFGETNYMRQKPDLSRRRRLHHRFRGREAALLNTKPHHLTHCSGAFQHIGTRILGEFR